MSFIKPVNDSIKYISQTVTDTVDYVSKAVSDEWNKIKNPNYAEIDADFKTVEKYLNKAGYIPGVSLLSGQLRELLGYTEIAAGLFFAMVHQTAANITHDKEAKERLYKQAEIDFSYCMNGFGNVVRGKVEQAPLWALTAVFYSKLAMIVYDALGIRMNYGHEDASESRFILLRTLRSL